MTVRPRKGTHVLEVIASAWHNNTGVVLTWEEVQQLMRVVEIRDAVFERWREQDKRAEMAAQDHRICYQPLNGPATWLRF